MDKIKIKHLSGREELEKPVVVKTTVDEIFTKIYKTEDWEDEIILDWVYVQGYMIAYDSFAIKRFLKNNKDEVIEAEQKFDSDVWFEISFKLKGKNVKILSAGPVFSPWTFESKNKLSNMKKLNEQGGEQIYSEAHAKELLNLQVNYNKQLQALNDKLAKQKSDLAVKYMKLDQQAAAQKATTNKAQVPPAQKQTGTVDTTGQPTDAQGNPPKNESIDILKINVVNEDDEEIRFTQNLLGYTRDPRNWYQKPEFGAGYVDPKDKPREKRKPTMTALRRERIQNLEYEIMDLESEKQNLIDRYINPESMSGEIEDFFGEIGIEAAEVLNSGAYTTTHEMINALIKKGFDERKAKNIVQVYHEYYPEWDPKKQKEKENAEKQIEKIQNKIDKLQARIDQWESMYESMNESLSTYNTEDADRTELQSLKDYMDAEGINYTEDENTIEFDDEQLDAEWRDLISSMGLEPIEISAEVEETPEDEPTLDVEDDDIDIVDVEDEIDEDKVFYVKVIEDGSEFTGKIYKLFDEGDWRAKIVEGNSDTFEKLNYDPEFDVFDIIAFLRENYDNAEIIEQSEFEEKVEEPEVKEALRGNGNIKDKPMKDVFKEAYKIPTLDEFKLDEGILKFTDGEVFNTDGPFRTEERSDGWYVLGHGFLVPVKSEKEGKEIVEEMNKKYGDK